MDPSKLYISTTASDASAAARSHGMGIEIAQFCTAWNMDEEFPETDARLHETLKDIPRRLLHAPFNELFPCAIDPRARQLAADRYRQAIALAKRYSAEKVIIHGGFHPWIYYPVWYVEQSVVFWKDFLREDPGVELVLENVLETEPGWLVEIVKGVDNPRLRLCLDVGHVNAYSPVPVMDWLDAWAPWLSHFHIHNNDGSWDTHSPLDQGALPVRELLDRAQRLCPNATFTLELMEAGPSVKWLLEE